MGYKKTIILFVCLITYLCLGAFVFIALEGGFHSALQERNNFYEILTDFVHEHSSCGVTQDNLLSFMREHVGVAQDRGVFRFDADSSKGIQDEWSLTNALVFSSEIVTTIGHGTLTPRTFKGRVVCIVYALIGVPLCCFMLAAVGDASLILADKIDRLLRRIQSSILLNAARLSVIILIFWSILVSIPTLIYTRTEGWTWVKAQYFSFTGMSTIGFGDVTISLRRHQDSQLTDWFYKAGTTVYCFLVLGVVSTVFKVCFRWHRNNIKQIRKKSRKWLRNNSVFKRRTASLAFNVRETRTRGEKHTTTLDY